MNVGRKVNFVGRREYVNEFLRILRMENLRGFM